MEGSNTWASTAFLLANLARALHSSHACIVHVIGLRQRQERHGGLEDHLNRVSYR